MLKNYTVNFINDENYIVFSLKFSSNFLKFPKKLRQISSEICIENLFENLFPVSSKFIPNYFEDRQFFSIFFQVKPRFF